ncbi:MAG: FHA domain-containing protein, partial [Deltaproteobacteria bacterium]|nr:FHA domain-containing protein [Deltaproteobacteria bacterium]
MRLVVARGPEPVGPFELRPGANYLGRDGSCEVHLPSKRVSRRHAVAFLSGARLTLKDNGSANGLYEEGGHRCEVLELVPGQRVQVGDYVLRFEAAELDDDVDLDIDDPLAAEDDLLFEEDEENTPVRQGPVPVPRALPSPAPPV